MTAGRHLVTINSFNNFTCSCRPQFRGPAGKRVNSPVERNAIERTVKLSYCNLVDFAAADCFAPGPQLVVQSEFPVHEFTVLNFIKMFVKIMTRLPNGRRRAHLKLPDLIPTGLGKLETGIYFFQINIPTSVYRTISTY